jgi:deoxyribodipyrimidine photo-lyase
MSAIFIFHNDLRINDNTGLIKAAQEYDTIIPVFIFTPEQITTSNKYRSIPAIEFMVSQLEILSEQIRHGGGRLYFFYGDTIRIVSRLIKEISPSAIYSNANYTPYALDRDSHIYSKCEKLGVDFILSEDYGLFEIGRIHKGSSDADPKENTYKKFTPYYNSAIRVKPNMTQQLRRCNFYGGNISGTITLAQVRHKFGLSKTDIKTASSVIRSLRNFSDYNRNRNMLTYETTHLSAYLKFGIVSAREVYWEIRSMKGASDLLKQLFWREFYMNILWAFPHVLGRNFNLNYHANWITSGDTSVLKAWCSGKTGFPIVDACMNQLNKTGFMHNRGRLIVAGFLTKVLGWHWKFGERYFATRLVDYDPAQNNGNWQFVAGSGVDQQPYFRMFNPWLQSAKYDPDAQYINYWCPYYSVIPADVLHDEKKLCNYISDNRLKIQLPIVSYVKSRDKTKKRYK